MSEMLPVWYVTQWRNTTIHKYQHYIYYTSMQYTVLPCKHTWGKGRQQGRRAGGIPNHWSIPVIVVVGAILVMMYICLQYSGHLWLGSQYLYCIWYS